MSVFRADLDLRGFHAKTNRAEAVFGRTLDRFVSRGAHEFAREEKLQAPKAFSAMTQSIAVQQNGTADYSVVPTARYAEAVEKGGKPHLAPLLPLYLWLKYTKRVSDEKELRARTYGLRRFIAKHGTKANPFVNRTRIKMQGRVVRLVRDGVAAATQEAFGK
ncbi:hypothetical protein EDC30_10992 [Paucimonas lemoignei]|uniref:HK97 gp10 family phage protein n=1 Tax=Paucimonas lemoignei TaxID=29443 RepID=A0A4R3HTI8_PAULE|nr:hypothetical protein [Paucimonas lemoignei]TCS35793.1 hypothetical protein EDC30_10992 [Paucimonas lemoignei]